MNKNDAEHIVVSILNNHCVMCDCSTDMNQLGAHCEGNFEGANAVPKDICSHPMAREAFAATTTLVLVTANITGETAYRIDPEAQVKDEVADMLGILANSKKDPHHEAVALLQHVDMLIQITDIIHDHKDVPWQKASKIKAALAEAIATINDGFAVLTTPIVEYADQIKKDHMDEDVKIVFTPKRNLD